MGEMVVKTLAAAVLVTMGTSVGWHLYIVVRGILDPEWKKRTDANIDSDGFGSHF